MNRAEWKLRIAARNPRIAIAKSRGTGRYDGLIRMKSSAERAAARRDLWRRARLSKRERRRLRKERVRRGEVGRMKAALDELPSESAQLNYLIGEMQAGWPVGVNSGLLPGAPRAP